MTSGASRRRGTSGRRAAAVPLAALAVVLSGCGEDARRAEPSSADDVRTAPTSRPVTEAAGGGTATPAPEESEQASSSTPPTDEPPTDEPPADDQPDLDGDGRADRVALVEVPDLGWSFDVVLADGRETSAPLPGDLAVVEDVAVLGGVDLDADGRDEVLVRTLRAVGGENAVVFRLDGDGVWLVRTPEGTAWELSTSGGMSGPRSYDCADSEGPRRVVLTRESERGTSTDGAPAYTATTVTWRLDGHGVTAVAKDVAGGVPPEQVALDPSTCTG